MRAALWLLAIFGIAVAAALFAGDDQGTVTVFWQPWRVDLSLNLVLLALVAAFVLLHLALRALSALFGMPQQARQWRAQQRERSLHVAMLDALSQLMAGRYLRARKAALAALAQEASLREAGTRLPQADQVRALAHLLAAESAQSLQDKSARDQHLQQALETRVDGRATRAPAETREAAQLRSARWALEDHDPQGALERLAELPQGAARRTVALRVRLKAARQARQSQLALETARLLAKHRAFSQEAAQGIVRSLGHELLGSAHDATQLERVWNSLDAAERTMPELAIQAAQRMALLGHDSAASRTTARQWLLPIWDKYAQLGDTQRVRLVAALEKTLHATVDPALDGTDVKAREDDAAWLARIETAQQRAPRDANLQYLCGMGCIQRQLWGKAQQLLGQAAMGLQDATLHRNAWRALATLAEQRGDAAAAQVAYRKAAEV